MTDNRLKQELTLAGKRVELEAERDRLRERLGQVEDKIRALDLIMHDRQFLAYVLSRSEPASEGGPMAAHAGNGSLAGMGLREAIRTVLALINQPMKPIEVTQQLVSGGYAMAADVRLKLRVSQEMHRMMRASKLKRLPSGRYRLVDIESGVEAK